jgi:hypothetical protein
LSQNNNIPDESEAEPIENEINTDANYMTSNHEKAQVSPVSI